MSESTLQFRLLGGHDIRYQGKTITLALPHKGRALLVYLLLSERIHQRKEIAAFLWPQADLDMAQRSLRVLLTILRKTYHLTPFIKTDRIEIGINNPEEIWCDVLDFRKFTGSESNAGSLDPNTLQRGIDLYLGKFMLGFDATDTPFDDWLYQQQIALEETVLHGLVALIEQFDAEDNPRAAIEYAYRLVDIDPWREASYRRLMRVLARCDRADAALFAYENCCQILQRELAVLPEQETIALAEQIRQAKILAVQTEPTPPLMVSSAVPFMAPAGGGPFVGREQVMHRLQAVLSEKDGRFRTCLTGMGGIGKTTIALQLAHRFRAYFPDGVLWADAAQEEPLTIVDRWASAYGYDLHHVKNEQERMIALRSILAEKQALIVVDDVSSAAAVRPLLPENGLCKVLLTSRSEDVARLLDAQPIRVDGLSAENGRSLLSHFIPAKRANQEPQAVAAICDLLHHLPLALVIAGNYLLERQQMRLSDFVEQLKTATQKLDISNANRQVRASFNVSWQALHPEEKQWFRMLGVFNGRHFSVEAFAAVAELDPFTAEARLQNLVQVSLLNRVENGRFRQHPLLAEFAREKLPKHDPVYLRMIHYFVQFAGVNQANYENLQPEWENMTAGIETAHELSQWPIVLHYANALQDAWFTRGRYSEARDAFDLAVQAAMHLEDEQAMADIYYKWGQACSEQSDYQNAKEHFQKSLQLYADNKNVPGVGDVNYELSRIAINSDNYEEAEKLLLLSRHSREKIKNENGVAETLYQQARIYYRQGKYKDAETLCEQAAFIQEITKNEVGLIRTMRLQSMIAPMLAKPALSLAFAEKALKLAKKNNDHGETGMAYYSLAVACTHLNENEQALLYVEQGLPILQQIGDIHSQALIIYQKCRILISLGKYEAALHAANKALEQFRRLQDQYSEALTILFIGDCYSGLNQLVCACEKWKIALHMANRLQNQRLIEVLHDRFRNCES